MPDIVRGEIIDDAPEIRGSIDGVRGESAYAVAVRNGFVGTEEEWLASLKGEQGERGEQGIQGVKGDTGATGPKGDKGDQGERGPQGEQGTKGDTGAKGDKGDPGADGQPGAKGDKGDKGDTGDTGAKGDKGDKGDPGQGIPTGGTTGQVLKKSSATDYDAEWSDESGAVTDVQINGSSIVSDRVANVPMASTNAFGAIKIGSGLYNNSSNSLCLYPASASSIKSGSTTDAITPTRQHQATFYGLARASGDTTQSQSSNAVGNYTEEAKIAIQKMLGIYEAPWELIREDTGTNATSENIEITVDGNGQAFELTDVRVLFTTPTQDTEAAVGNYGRIRFRRPDSTIADTMYIGSYTQAAQTVGKTSAVQIIQRNGMIERQNWKNVTNNGDKGPISILIAPFGSTSLWELASKTYNGVLIESVTGTWHYWLYGKRKWS